MRTDISGQVTSRPEAVSSKGWRLSDGHNRLRIVVNNTLMSFGGQAITWVSTLALMMVYGRFLGANGFGELYLAITLAGLIGFPLEFGFNQQIIREVARYPQRAARYVSNALLLKIVLWALLCVALLIVVTLLHYSLVERLVIGLSGITLLVSSIGSAFSAMHTAVYRNVVPVTGSVIEKVLDALVAYLLLRFLHVDVIPIACVLLAGALLNALWQAAWFYQLEKPVFALDRATILELLRTSVPFLLYGALGVIYYRVDTVLLGVFDGATVVGLYGAGYKIFDTLTFLPGVIMAVVMYPMLARLSANDGNANSDDSRAYRKAVEKSTNFLLICGIPLATGLGVAAPAIVGALYHHEEFAPTILVMEALAPGLVLLYINWVISTIIVTKRREKSQVWLAAAALVLNVSLNLLLIPRYHEVAAAGVTSITELALVVMGLFAIPRDLIPFGSLPTLAKTLAASGVMALVILALGHFTILVILPAAAVTYALAGLAMRVVPREDALALIEAIRRKTSRGVVAIAPLETNEAMSAPRVTAASMVAARAAVRRSAPRSTPLAKLYASSRSVERARLVTRAGSRATSAPARDRRSVAAGGRPRRSRRMAIHLA